MKTIAITFLALVVCGPLLADDLAASEGSSSNDQQSMNSNTSSYVFPTAEERFRRYLNNSVGTGALFGPAIRAATDQANGVPEEWGSGAEGYAKRYGSRLALNLLTEATRYGASEAFRMDTGYKRCDCKGFVPRFGHALKESVIARRPNGRVVPDVPTFISPYTSAMIGVHSWYPDRFNWKDGVRIGTMQLAAEPIVNVFREFFPRFFR
jgi:hypothetical protein